MFNGTILENLTLFDDEKNHNRAIAAAKAVGLTDVIEHLPEGYEMQAAGQAVEVLPRGVNQRIGIARALLSKPSVVIFDEANAAMDMQSDAIIRTMLKRIIGKCTMILISRRPSMLALAQKHYVMEEGRLKEIA